MIRDLLRHSAEVRMALVEIKRSFDRRNIMMDARRKRTAFLTNSEQFLQESHRMNVIIQAHREVKETVEILLGHHIGDAVKRSCNEYASFSVIGNCFGWR